MNNVILIYVFFILQINAFQVILFSPRSAKFKISFKYVKFKKEVTLCIIQEPPIGNFNIYHV